MLDFYKTKAGKMFFDSHVPQIVIALKDIASVLRDKRVYEKKEEKWLIGSTLPNESIVVFKGEFANCKVMISRWTGYGGRQGQGKILESYYVWIEEQLLRSPAIEGDYGSLQECFEAIVDELG